MTATNDLDVIDQVVSEQTLDAQIAEMRIEVAAMRETLNHQVTLLGEIKGAIAPMLDKLSSNPLLRNFFGD